MSENKETRTDNILGASKTEKTVSIIAIAVSVILIPILILNCILLIKSVIDPDKVPSLGKLTPLIVLTESMELEILDGDLIMTKITPIEDIEIGDVISYFDPESRSGAVVTHRIIEITDNDDGSISFVTQGDNNDIADRTPVPEKNVIGVWTGFQVHYLGNVMLFMQSGWGILVCIAIPAICYIAYEIIRRQRQNRAKDDDIEALKRELEALKAKSGDSDADSEGEKNRD